MERQAGWFDLTDAEKDAAQHASGLCEVEALLRILHRRLDRSLRKMPSLADQSKGAPRGRYPQDRAGQSAS